MQQVPDAMFLAFAHYLWQSMPKISVVKVEPKFDLRSKKYSPMLFLTTRSSGSWMLKLWDAIPHMVAVELFASRLGKDLDLRVLEYFPFCFDRLGYSMGLSLSVGCPYKQTWGLISRFIPDCANMREDDSREYLEESMKRYWKDFIQLMVFCAWVDSRDATLTNWFIQKKTYIPTRGDFEGTYFRFNPRSKNCLIYTVAKDLLLFDREETRQFYDEIVDKILDLPLGEYFRGTVFEGFPAWQLQLEKGREILTQEDTFGRLIEAWRVGGR